ncbi:MAG: hypothetical protein NVSMB62_20750 [Acidobacteriaceae bacterium]
MSTRRIAPETSRLTRRQWLQTLPVPAFAAAALLTDATAHATVTEPSAQTATASLGARVYDITTFGAKGDRTTLNTAAVQAAIDACHTDGGGTVLVPAGVFRIGTVELRSNITLHLAASAVLLGSGTGADYHAVDAIPLTGDSTLNDGNWALLFAVSQKNIVIEGPGTIDGQGAQFHSAVRGIPPPSKLSGNNRPYHVLLHKCEDIRIRDLSLVDGAYHSIRIIQSRRIFIDSVVIHNRVNGNNDGFHFISAEHVTVSNCTVLSQDDGCAMFGSCKFINITNSTFSTRWSVFRFGGGESENITVSNCVLYKVYGCPIKFQGNEGSRFENISFSNIVLQEVTGPIHLGVGPRPQQTVNPGLQPEARAARPPAIARNISFSNISGTITDRGGQLPESSLGLDTLRPGEGHSAITLNCAGNATMENISLSNIHLTFAGGGTAEEGARRDLPQIAGEYFMLGSIPAYGLYARNIHGLTASNVRLQTAKADLRPAVILDHVTDAALNLFSVQADKQAESALRLIDCGDVLVSSPRLLTDTGRFLQLEGSTNVRITIDGGDISRATTPIEYTAGATVTAVKHRV